VIENRPGGAGLLAGDYVARADPDGHTLSWDRTGRSSLVRSPWQSPLTSGSRHSCP
jgi:tripartite-type tricarboxylate transporter receptor subunit TctC